MHTQPCSPTPSNIAAIVLDTRRLILRRFTQRPVFALLVLVALALVIDLSHIWQQPPALQVGETAHTWPIVLNLVHGHGYTACFHNYFPFCGPNNQETAQREPLPVLVFAGVALLTGDSLLAATMVNMGVHLAILLAVFWLTHMLAGRRAAFLAATLWVIYLPAVKLVESISGDLMATLWIVLAVAFLVYARKNGSWHAWVGAGVCVGCGALSRSAVLILAPVFVASLLLGPQGAFTLRAVARLPVIRSLAIFLFAVSLMLAPWVARNTLVFGHPVIGSTLVGYNLYRENYQLASHAFLRYVDGPEAKEAVAQLLARQRNLHGTENEAQVDAVYMQAALNVIAQHPRRYLLLTAYRGLMLWFDIGVATSDRTGNGGIAVLIIVEQALLLFLAIVSLPKRWHQLWPLVLSIGTICLSYMAVNSMVRYAIPIMPLVMTLSAIGAEQLRQWYVAGFRGQYGAMYQQGQSK